MKTRVLLLLALGLSWLASPAVAQQWPSAKPIRIVVAYPPGGSTDLMARLLAQKLAPVLGQTVVVENRPGAAGQIGTAQVAKADADGYTLLFTNAGPGAVGYALLKSPTYHPVRDFAPVATMATMPLVMAVGGNSPYRSVAELIAAAKAQPGHLNYATTGNGSVSHIATELFSSMAGIQLTHVPYKGGAQTVPAVMTGEVAFFFSVPSDIFPQVQAGKMRAHRRRAEPTGPGSADDERSRRQGFRGRPLVRPAGAARRAARGGRASQPRDQRRAAAGRCARSALRRWLRCRWRSRPRTSQPRSRATSKSGAASSRPTTSVPIERSTHVERRHPGRTGRARGAEIGCNDWVTIDQPLIDRFADVTGDRNWYHVDLERAARELPGGRPIAHGLLTLSLVPGLAGQIVQVRRHGRAFNYGFDRVRYPVPVAAGDRVRLRMLVLAPTRRPAARCSSAATRWNWKAPTSRRWWPTC